MLKIVVICIYGCVFFTLCTELKTPELKTCLVSVIRGTGDEAGFKQIAKTSPCHDQRNETIKTQPTVLHFVVQAEYNSSSINRTHNSPDPEVGSVYAQVSLVTISVAGL